MNAPPGWYIDPADPTIERWWDGETWSDVARHPQPRIADESASRPAGEEGREKLSSVVAPFPVDASDVALWLSVAGIFMFGLPAIVGIVVGLQVRRAAKRAELPTPARATVAIVLGFTSVLLWIAILAAGNPQAPRVNDPRFRGGPLEEQVAPAVQRAAPVVGTTPTR